MIRSRDVATALLVSTLLTACGTGVSPTSSPSASPVTDVQDIIDHYLCYHLDPAPLGPKVPQAATLIDQFGMRLSPILRRESLCNPVDKEDVLRKHPNDHLVCYTIQAQPPPNNVVGATVSNQLANAQVLAIGQSVTLCVPSGKSPVGTVPPQIPTDLDHFKCYTVHKDTWNPVVEHLTDQFIKNVPVRVIGPSVLCNPAEKRYDDVDSGPRKHAGAHLTCYALDAVEFIPRNVQINNQFENVNVTVRRPSTLCVPSTKDEVRTKTP